MMEKLRLLIVDDEPLAHKVLEGYCEKIDFVEVIGNCYDGLSTLNFLNQHKVDAILLDIQMPDLTGMELLDTLKENAPKIIFTTAYTDYALQSFEYDQVVDYLHKPVRISRFLKALARLQRILQLEKEQRGLSIQSSDSSLQRSPTVQNFLSLKDNKVLHKIKFDEILYVQSWGNYIKVFLKNEEILLARKTISEIERVLPLAQFERIHKSYLVNLAHVVRMEGNQLVIGDQHLPIGKVFQLKVRERMMGG